MASKSVEMKKKSSVLSLRVVILLVVFVIGAPMLPLIISGRWNWWEAWVFAAVSIGGFVVSRALANRKNPGLIEERAQYNQQEDTKSWDKVLSPVVALGGTLLPLAAGLEARFGDTSPFSLPIKIAALVIILASYALGAYALIANRFFSGTVRIQKERGHTVISSGPYRWVRHPGYSSAIFTYLAVPFFLDSLWTLLFAAVLVVLLILRTALEDRTLQEELEGYREYSKRVRFRLIPGIW